MKVKCKYCGNEIEDTRYTCNFCGGPVEQAQRSSIGEPQTIEELKQWYKEHELPPEEVTRFFIGRLVKEKKAFGIYRQNSTGDFVVYKNKADGTQAIRYKGKDEKYAVNELYQRLKEEVTNQKMLNSIQRSKSVSNTTVRRRSNSEWTLETIFYLILIIVTAIGVMYALIHNMTSPKKGYYNYDGDSYYYYRNHWYRYEDDNDQWIEDNTNVNDLEDNWKEYRSSKTEETDKGISTFESSDYYRESGDSNDWDDDWDNDSSWDSSDSWDSDSTDWDSDW